MILCARVQVQVDLAGSLDAIQLRHGDIHNDDVGVFRRRQIHGGGTTGLANGRGEVFRELPFQNRSIWERRRL